jgi:rusticyanin
VNRKHAGLIAAAAVLIAGGTGTGLALAASGTNSPASPAPPAAATAAGPGYAWYRSMMGSLDNGSMMGGTGYGWMMGATGYRWMMGQAATAPAWMRGHAVPGFMMGTSHDPGGVMGRLWANAPGPRVSPAQASRLGSEIPVGATADRAANRITFTGSRVRIVVLTSPSGGPDETFRVGGLVNPAIVVTAGSSVSIEVINADPDTAHGLVVTASQDRSSWMPMMTAAPAFRGSALWFLGNPTSAGMHAGTLTFTASTPGAYHYLCPVPGHAQKGMTGTFIVRTTG